MKLKKSFGEKVFDIINVILLSLLAIVCFYPILYVAFASLSNGNLLLAYSGILLKPLGFSVSAYLTVLKNPMILRGYIITIIVASSGLLVNLLMTSMAAYVLSRKNVYFKNVMIKVIVFTMLFNGGIIPLYLTVKGLGLYNNLLALILPNAIITFNMIIMRTGFMSIPDSMEESAKIDGANDFTVLFRIIIPLSMPVVAVMILYYGVYHWNSWFNAMIFLQDRALYPLQLILREILISSSMNDMAGNTSYQDMEQVSESIKYATIMVATLPVLFIYPFIQKYFIKGVMIGALKE